MRTFVARFLLCAVALSASHACVADIRLPAVIGDAMVLQRDSKIRLWGWADPAADPSGHWSVSLGPYPAGGPYEMSIVGKNSVKLSDILIGDVWVASGQSNMELQIRFSNMGSGLLIRDKYGYGRGFELAGTDGKYRWAQARLEGQDIIVSSPLVRHPASVRYAWSNTPDGNVYNREALPAVSFRTDNSPD
jgi:hypothetical protein